MRSGLVAFVSATALSLSSGANAGRACLNGTTTSTGSYEWRLSDFRYDGPYPGKDIQWSTIVANLGGTSETPLFECAVRWPECWAGWKEGGSNIIWSECIWIGDGDDASVDKTISFAVDWKSRIMYLSHTFACSDKGG
jgi:hypothetical protein